MLCFQDFDGNHGPESIELLVGNDVQGLEDFKNEKKIQKRRKASNREKIVL